MSFFKQSREHPGLRFFGSCLVALLYWAVWLASGATLAVLIFIISAKQLPVPDFLLRRVEARFAEANLTIKVGRAQLDPTGKILLEAVEVRSRQFQEPLLTSRLVYVRRSFWSILAGQPIPDEIQLEGVTIQLPAMLSPSGTTEPLVRDLAIRLSHDDRVWHIEQLAGRIGSMVITAQGHYILPAHQPATPALSVDQMIGQFLKLGRQIGVQLPQLDGFIEPSLHVDLESDEGMGNVASVVFTAKGARHPLQQPMALGAMTASSVFRIDGSGGRIVRWHVQTKDMRYQEKYFAENIRATINLHLSPENFTVRIGEVNLAVGAVEAEGERLLGSRLRANLANWPEVRTAAAWQIAGYFISANIEADVKKKTAFVTAEGRVSEQLISRNLEKYTPRAAPFFIFGAPITFSGEANLGPSWHFDRLTTRVATGGIDSRGVKITAARGQIEIKGMNFLAHDARVEMGENLATGSYWMNFATTDYRMLLNGRLQPREIGGWFTGSWWTDFWQQRFGFSTKLPEADVDVNGRWREVDRTEYFGGAQVDSAKVWGGSFDHVEALVFLRPYFTHIIESKGVRAQGAEQVGGWLKRFADKTTKNQEKIEFNFSGNLDPATTKAMLEGKLDDALADLLFSRPPEVEVSGTITGNGNAARSNYSFNGHATGGLHYYGFPLDEVAVTGTVNEDRVALTKIDFTTAGGKGSGTADLSGAAESRRLGFDFHLHGADLARTILAVEEYQTNLTGEKGTSVTESKLMKHTAGGRIDVALSALGVPGELRNFTGNGSASLTGTELGEIHLFGMLSQMLSGLSLNFSSLTLDAAHTTFKLSDGRLRFPDLKVTGPTAVIDAYGTFTLGTNDLNFTAKLKPFKENKTLFTTAIGMVLNPLTSMLELKLTGPVSKPSWSIEVGTSSTPASEPTGSLTPPVGAAPETKAP